MYCKNDIFNESLTFYDDKGLIIAKRKYKNSEKFDGQFVDFYDDDSIFGIF